MATRSGPSEPPPRPPRPALWALADCNNFYVACEQLFRPDLKGRPVVVLSNNDGCIVSRSKEAKALGIKMGAPEFQVRDFLKRHDVAVFSSNYALYGDISARVMSTLARLCPVVDQYSIDEAFLPLDAGTAARATELARNLRDTVRRWTGITISIGVAPTKTLAKVANHLAKQGDGVTVLDDMRAVPGILRDFPVDEVWGIGRRLAEKLAGYGIRRALTFAEMDDDWIRRHCTVSGLRTALELRGVQALTDDEPTPRRTLVVSRSFGSRVHDRESLAQAVASFTVRAAERLRKAGLAAGGLAVHIRTGLHGKIAPYDVTGQRRLAEPTGDTGVLLAAALSVLQALYRKGPAYAKAGVMLFDLVETERMQYPLFPSMPQKEAARREALMRALDDINGKLGPGALRFGAEGGDGNATWRMRRDRVSPRATTEWAELPRVKCG